MIYHLLRHLHDPFTNRPLFGFYAYENVMFRSVAATLTSLVIALVIGPKVIRWLMRKKIGDRPEFHHATLNELTKEKANTPTMGGLIIILALTIGIQTQAKDSSFSPDKKETVKVKIHTPLLSFIAQAFDISDSDLIVLHNQMKDIKALTLTYLEHEIEFSLGENTFSTSMPPFS